MGKSLPEQVWITSIVQQSQVDLIDWTFDTLPQQLSKLLDPNDNPRHISNVSRYWLLYEYGGLWLDHDVIPFRDLTGSSRPWTASLRGHREGCALWFPTPGHPMLADLVAASLTTDFMSSPYRSGAHLLDRVGRRYSDVTLEQRVLPLDAMGRRTSTEEVWAVHLWNSSAIKPQSTLGKR
jgi:hypothetical protein